jgi:ABC-type multidrug transport system permease subunit
MDAQVLKFVRLGLEVITDRLISILALLSSAGLASWVMWGPEWERVATLAIFTIFAYALVKSKEKVNEAREETSASP